MVTEADLRGIVWRTHGGGVRGIGKARDTKRWGKSGTTVFTIEGYGERPGTYRRFGRWVAIDCPPAKRKRKRKRRWTWAPASRPRPMPVVPCRLSNPRP